MIHVYLELISKDLNWTSQMIKNIKIENFKSWENLELNFSPISGMFGPNSSGKSSLLQFLLMLKQTKETIDRSLALDFGGSKSYANLGNFLDVIFNHETKKELKWEIKWKLPKKLELSDPLTHTRKILFRSDEMELKAAVSLRNQLVSTNYLEYIFDNQNFILKRKKSKPSSFKITSVGESNFRFIRNVGRVWDMPSPVKSYAFPDRAKTYFQNAGLLSNFERSYEDLIDNIYYLGPLREYPKREYIWSGSSPLDVGPRGERVVDALLAAKSRDEKRNLGPRKRNKSFEEMIAYWLKELGLIYDFNVIEIAESSNLYKVQIKKDKKSAPVLITDVGFGLSQFLPVLVLLYYVPKNSVVLLEQPEIHLHPAVQSGLADVLINAVKTRKIQVVVESHSEHLLRRLQRRVAEDEISNDDISLYFSQTVDGKSKITPLRLNLFGEIANWPKEFFGDELGEITATKKAGIKKKIRSQK